MWGKFLANSGMGNNLLPESQIKLTDSVSHTRAFVSIYLPSKPAVEVKVVSVKPKPPKPAKPKDKR